jgi:hypothetical protein
MIYFGSPKRSVTIDTLYAYCKQNQQTLLPTEDFDFWEGYENNYEKFDRYFFQKFRAFKVLQEYGENTTITEMLSDWKQIVDAHLFINAKRYSELYRVQVLAADAYDVVNNYDVHEEYERDNTGTQSMNEGQRQDSTAYGAKQDTNNYGQAQRTEQYGARQDTNNTTLGTQTSNSTEKRSAFNSGLTNVAGGEIENGSRQDSATLNTGAHTDTHTDAARTDTLNSGAHTDNVTKGAQLNQRTDNLKEESTMHRYGNIGVQTPADVIGGHLSLWDAFKFYEMIFDEIALNYLVIDVDFDFSASNASGGGGGGDAELLAAIRALSAQLAAAQADINDNVDTAETNIRGDITSAKTAIRGDLAALDAEISADTSAIRGDVDAAETAIRGDISTLSTKTTNDTSAIRGDILEVTTNGY